MNMENVPFLIVWFPVMETAIDDTGSNFSAAFNLINVNAGVKREKTTQRKPKAFIGVRLKSGDKWGFG